MQTQGPDNDDTLNEVSFLDKYPLAPLELSSSLSISMCSFTFPIPCRIKVSDIECLGSSGKKKTVKDEMIRRDGKQNGASSLMIKYVEIKEDIHPAISINDHLSTATLDAEEVLRSTPFPNCAVS
jgi:hypothetical protein